MKHGGGGTCPRCPPPGSYAYGYVSTCCLLSKKHRRGNMKADMHHCCYCISKRMTKEALQNHCMRK